jgi:hypothetical protein
VGEVCGTHGRGEKIVQGFSGKARRKNPLERPRRRLEDGIRTELMEIDWEDGEWVQLARDRGLLRAVVNALTNLRDLAPQSKLF